MAIKWSPTARWGATLKDQVAKVPPAVSGGWTAIKWSPTARWGATLKDQTAKAPPAVSGGWTAIKWSPTARRDAALKVQTAKVPPAVSGGWRTTFNALLAGRLFDDRGNRMSPSFSTKRGIRYFFYVSSALMRGHKDMAGSIGRVSAPELEAAVIKAARAYVRRPEPEIADRALVQTHIARVMVSKGQVRIEFEHGADGDQSEADEFSEASGEPVPNHVLLPWSPASTRPLIKIDEQATGSGLKPNSVLVQAIARAHFWLQQLSNGTCATVEELAIKNNIHPKVARKAIRLAFLAPQITSMIISGEQPQSMTLATLHDASVLSWSEQQKSLNLA
jgi:site-specific DNA recombinase